MPAVCSGPAHSSDSSGRFTARRGDALRPTTSTSSVVPSRVGEIFLQIKQSLARFAGVQVHQSLELGSHQTTPLEPRRGEVREQRKNEGW